MEIKTSEYFDISLINYMKPNKYKMYVCSTSKDIGIMINYFLKFIKNKNLKKKWPFEINRPSIAHHRT